MRTALKLLLRPRGNPTFTDDFARADGAAGNGWTNLLITSNSGYLSPTVGSTLIANGNMETGSPPTGWTAGASATLTAAADERTGGSGVQSLQIAHGGSPNPQASRMHSTAGWLLLECWIKNVDASSGRLDINNMAFTNNVDITSTSWTLARSTVRSTSTSGSIILSARTITAARAARFDDASVQAITIGTMFGYRTFAAGNRYAQFKLTRVANTQMGVCHFVDDNNFVIAYMDGFGNLRIEKRVAGTYTSVATTGVTYSAGAVIRLTRTDTTYSATYNGSPAGSGTISDSAFTTTDKWGIFSSWSGNLADDFECGAA